jgi:hypothetical protein
MSTQQDREQDRDTIMAAMVMAYREGDWATFHKAVKVLEARQCCEGWMLAWRMSEGAQGGVAGTKL